MLCLIAERYFGIPGPALPGRGKRFDIAASMATYSVFSSQGTSHRSNQQAQIDSGWKEKAHHARGGPDVELIISSCISHNGDPPEFLADPDRSPSSACTAGRQLLLPPSALLSRSSVHWPSSKRIHLNRHSQEYLRTAYRSIAP
jgi:hypothetical protein